MGKSRVPQESQESQIKVTSSYWLIGSRGDTRGDVQTCMTEREIGCIEELHGLHIAIPLNSLLWDLAFPYLEDNDQQ